MTPGNPEVRVFTSAPVTTGTVVWQSRGQMYVSIAVKATFALVHNQPMELVEPAEMFRAELHHRDNPSRSIRATSDVVPYLRRADVVLTGHACAPEGAPAAMVAVRLAIFREGPILDKAAHVYGDLKKGAVTPFEKLPLVYERAIGGVGWEGNPLGVGMRAGGPSDPSSANVVHPSDPSILVGFGPISRTWPARRRLLGKADRKALERPIVSLPDDFDWDYFQSAPPDQQIDFLRGDEWVVLEGMHPSLPRIASRLPNARALGSASGAAPGDAPRSLDFHADILRIDADAQSCSVVWRAACPVRDEAEIAALAFRVGLEIAGKTIEWSDEVSLADEDVLDAPADTVSIDMSDDALTIQRVERGPRPEKTTLWTPEMAAELRKPPPELSAKFEGTYALSLDDQGRAAEKAAVPFGAQSAPPAPISVARPIPGAPWSGPASSAAPARLMEPHEETFDSAELQAPSVAPPPPSVALPPPSVAPPASSAAPSVSKPPPPLPPRPAPGRAASMKAREHVPRRVQDAVPVAGKSPFTVFTTRWQMKAGVDSLAVIVKATCDLVADGPALLRAEAEPPSGDVHDGGDPGKTVIYPTDFAPFKPRADVVLSGHVYAPRGSSPAAQARFRFGHRRNGFERKVAVFGERRWQKAGIKIAPTEPRAFKKVPLVYERAFGGPSFDRNPAGLGQLGDLLPQLEDPASLLQSPSDTPEPVCFAAVPPSWPGRRSKLGTFDAEWKKTRWPFFPDDFDWAFFQAAPPGQQLEPLNGDEPYELAGVHAEHPAITGKLPGVRPRCFAQRTSEAGGEFHEVLLRLDTVTFEPDRGAVTLVWRGLMDVQGDDAHDVAELFVFEEAMGRREVDRAEAYSKYRAAKLPPVEAPASDATPANETRPEPQASGGDRRREEKLAAAGFDARAAEAPPPAETIDLSDEELEETDTPPPEIAEPALEEREAMTAQVRALLEGGGSLEGLELDGAALEGFDFSGRSLRDAKLSRAKLSHAKLARADLTGAQLGGADLRGADLTGATLAQADVTGADLTGAVLDFAKVDGAVFANARADGSRWNEASGDFAVLVEASLRKARFERAALGSLDLTRAVLDGAVLDGAALREVRLYDAQGTGVSFKGATLDGARADGVTLRRSVLSRVQARSSVWDRATLDESTFLGAVMPESGFVRASCKNAVLSGADLTGARLRKATLSDAALLKANLMEASLEGADLERADLRGANLHGAETLNARLGGVRLDMAIVTGTKLAERP